jgi:hypothetical protein
VTRLACGVVEVGVHRGSGAVRSVYDRLICSAGRAGRLAPVELWAARTTGSSTTCGSAGCLNSKITQEGCFLNFVSLCNC